jgi:hypothetical protein
MSVSTITIDAAPTTGDLTVLATVRRELELADAFTADDAWLADAIRQASDLIASYCRRPEGFGRATVTQAWRLTRDPPRLILKRDLAPSIFSITEDGTTLASTDWLLDGSLLYRLRSDEVGLWTASKVIASYSAGFTLLSDVPFDLERACLDLVVRSYRSRGRDPGLRSQDVPDVLRQSWDTPGGDGFRDGLPRDVADRLSPFRRYDL